jgi:Fic family protein
MNALDWIHGSMRLDGSTISREETETILKGGVVRSARLDDHVSVERYSGLIKATNDMLAMSYYINKKMLLAFHQKLTGDHQIGYRKENPVLLAYNYNPPHPSEIEEQMELVMNWFYSGGMEANPVLRAACLHLRIIEVYPFDTFSEAVARAAMYYCLMENGLPPFEISMREQEYNVAIMAYLKTEDPQPFYMEVERGLYNKMEVLTRLTQEG